VTLFSLCPKKKTHVMQSEVATTEWTTNEGTSQESKTGQTTMVDMIYARRKYTSTSDPRPAHLSENEWEWVKNNDEKSMFLFWAENPNWPRYPNPRGNMAS
jgi:hypothetical protein